MHPRNAVVSAVMVTGLLTAGCGSTNVEPALEAAVPADATPQVGLVDEFQPVVEERVELEERFAEYKAADQLPVASADREIVGYMNFTDYYAGTQDPAFIEVWSYDDDSLIGYRIRSVGFLPLEELEGDETIAERVEAQFGERQAEEQARHDELNDRINSLSDEELRAVLEQVAIEQTLVEPS